MRRNSELTRFVLVEGFQRRLQLFDEARQDIGGGCGLPAVSAPPVGGMARDLAVRGPRRTAVGVDEQKLPLDPRKTYAGQAKAQRTNGFEYVDITFEESTPPQDPDSGPR